MKKLKRLASILLCLVMVSSLFTVGANAAVSYDAPAAGAVVNDKIITGSAYAASTVALSILGVNVVSSNGAGIYNGGGTTGNYGLDSSNLGIFGSDINDNPDPYLYNYFYNLNSTQSGGGDYSDDSYGAWTATPYTLRWDSNKSGPSGQASGSVTISLMGRVVTANPAFFYEPDIIIGEADSYIDELVAYQEAYNADYDPVFVGNYGTSAGGYAASGSRANYDGLGLEYNMFDMGAGLVAIARAVEEIAQETGKTTRYGESAYEIATNYDKYDRGLYYWAQSQFASGGLTKINYASSVSYDTDLDCWTVTQGTDRSAQYASGIGSDIYDLLSDGYTFQDGTVVEASTISTSTGGPGGMGGRPGGMGGQGSTATATGYYLTTSQLIEILSVTGGDGKTYPGVIIGREGTAPAYDTLKNAGVSFLGNLPACVYGMTMQTCENGMGIPFYLSYFYYEQNNSLSPVNMIAYWMEHFYHVTDVEAMQKVITNMLEEADLPGAYYYDGSVNIDEYDDGAVEDMIVQGIAYYHSIEEGLKAQVAASGDKDLSALLWNSLDESIGIGSSSRNTNASAADSITGYQYFTDVAVSDWYFSAVTAAKERGYMNGVTARTFGPNDTLDRAMLATILYRMAGSPAVSGASPYSDVASGTWYTDAVIWAAENGIVTGYDDGRFGPSDPVTREQTAVMLYRYAVYSGVEAVTQEENLTSFADGDQISAYAVSALNWAVGQKIMSGKDGNRLDPTGNATRGEAATILVNYAG